MIRFTAAVFFAVVVLGAARARAAEPRVDVELREAAQLHRAGQTPAALAVWKKWAEQGNADAAYNLAVVHQHADGVPQDLATAAKWYRVAAELGDKASRVQLGLMYQNGEGVPADQALAQEWFTKSRREHAHHHHDPQFQQWQARARALLDERDRLETAARARRDGEQVLAELRRRAGTTLATRDR
jgi:hypothetical protein